MSRKAKKDDDSSTLSLTSPRPRSVDEVVVPTLVIIAGNCGVGRLFRIEQEVTVVGRGESCEICLDDDTISRKHARIERVGNELRIVDLASRNGTFVGDTRIDNALLNDGDRVQIGSATIMKFSYRDSLDEALQRNLYESATRDSLTGVHNKKYFLEMLDKELKFSSRRSTPLSMLLLDLDHFKRINDNEGHLTGDRVLAQIATAINRTVRAHDLFARWGGEEFCIMLRDCSLTHAMEAGERVRHLVEALTVGDGLKVTVSIGVACAPAGQQIEPDALIKAADQELYRAKDAGRNAVRGPAPQGPTAEHPVIHRDQGS